MSCYHLLLSYYKSCKMYDQEYKNLKTDDLIGNDYINLLDNIRTTRRKTFLTHCPKTYSMCSYGSKTVPFVPGYLVTAFPEKV